jgi:nucleoside-diphosphate-sugar epimerase
MKFYTSGGTGFVDVRDVSKAILLLLQSDSWESVVNQRFVLSAENLSYRDLFGKIAVALHKPQPSLSANHLLLQLGWRASWLVSAITGKQPSLTRETANSAGRTTLYDGSKITRTIDFAYTPVDRTIQEIGKIFLDDVVS